MPSTPSAVVSRARTCQFASTVRPPATYGRSTGTRSTLTATCVIFTVVSFHVRSVWYASRSPAITRPPMRGAPMQTQSKPEVRRLGPQIGVEVRGVDVKALDDASFAVLYRAWLDGNILVVPDQELEIDDLLRYSRRFGVVVPHPSKMTRHPDYPEITLLGVNKFAPDGQLNMAIYRRGAEGWHTDGAYDQDPFKATQLYAVAVPSTGGDTLFASLYAAYEALPTRLQRRLDGRQGAFTYGGRRKATALLNEEDRDWTPVFHPIVRTHPETGRKALYFDPGKILRIEGLEEHESDAVIEELKGYMIQPAAQYRHRS